ncbi:6-phosphofructokinase [Vibrio harveyi]|nr:6-phosphofructokinase [Vibrio harveyi]
MARNYTIGFHTALDTIINAIDKIRSTIQSHKRTNVIEIMGNNCGDLVTYSAIATSSEIFSPSEDLLTIDEIAYKTKELFLKNKKSVIILISEKSYDLSCEQIAKKVEKISGYETKSTVLGHMQRGGIPTSMDRYLGYLFGNYAVELLLENKSNLAIGIKDNKLIALDIKKALEIKKTDNKNLINNIIRNLSFLPL